MSRNPVTGSVLESISPRMTRRLAAAEGYLELDLPGLALEELNRVDPEALGPLSSSYLYLLGEALRMQERYEEATGPLEQAAREMPGPLRAFAWSALSDCYAAQGNEALSEFAKMLSKSHSPEESATPVDLGTALVFLKQQLQDHLKDLLSEDEFKDLEAIFDETSE